MPKIAELHNGTQIHFPDHVGDEEMDQTVQRHLGVTPPNPDMLQAILQAIGAHAGAVTANKADNSMQMHSDNMQAQQAMHAERMQAAGEHTKAIGAVGQTVGNGFEAMMHPLAELAQNSAQIPALVQAINGLASTITEVGKAIIASMDAPKETEIHPGADGKPRISRTTKRKS